ncbi:sigma-70 family RNA polymerase sigma factor [Candidatus Woesearchaeota archaeon]|nr:sigma-70 family RNA polymerase sigma factor [Candidatus Woesearchaeota archaeon]
MYDRWNFYNVAMKDQDNVLLQRDADVIAQSPRGDGRASLAVFDSMQRRAAYLLFLVAEKFKLKEDVADDAVQEGYFGLRKALCNYDGRVPFTAFACLAIKRRIIDYLNKKYCRDRFEQDYKKELYRTCPVDHSRPRDVVEGKEISDILKTHMQRLPDVQREAVESLMYEGDCQPIAPTVRWRRWRGLMRLRQIVPESVLSK